MYMHIHEREGGSEHELGDHHGGQSGCACPEGRFPVIITFKPLR